MSIKPGVWSIGRIALFMGLLVCASNGFSKPTVAINRFLAPPVIDGVLSDACWAKAIKVGGFSSTRTAENGVIMRQGLADIQTVVRMGYDDTNLYLAFECLEPEPGQIRAAGVKRDYDVVKNDHIELFIQPDTTVSEYDHFGLAPNDLKYDQRVTVKNGIDYAWEPDWSAKAKTLDDRWIAEIAIPFTSLNHADPQMGQTWGLLLARDRQAGNGEASCWPEIKGLNWHSPQSWGNLTGLILGVDRKGVDVASCEVGVPTVGTNSLAVQFVNQAAADREIKAEIKVIAPGKAQKQTTVDLGRLAGNETKQINLAYELALEEGRHTINIILEDASGKVLCQAPPVRVDIPTFITGFLDRSYYTGEKEAEACIYLDKLQPSIRQNCNVRGRIVAKDKTVWSAQAETPLKEKVRLKASLVDIPVGCHAFEVVLETGKGAKISTMRLALKKYAPFTEGTESKILIRDRGDCIVLVNGQPFFPLTYFHDRPALSEDVFQDAAQAGFNEIYHWTRGRPQTNASPDIPCEVAELKRQLDLAQKAGIYMTGCGFYMVERPTNRSEALDFAMSPERFQAIFTNYWLPRLEKNIPVVARHPALIGWNQFDEVPGRHMPVTFMFTQKLHELDPYHNVTLCTLEGGFNLPNAGDAGEIFRNDAYLYTDYRMPTAYYKALELVESAKRANRVPSITMQTETTSQIRLMTYAEQRCAAYLAIVAGARGLQWFAGRPAFLEAWQAIKRVVAEVKSLAPVLLAPHIEQRFTLSPKDSASIFARLFKKDRDYYLVAVNAGMEPAAATIKIEGLKPQTKAREFYKGTELVAADAGLKLEFGAYEALVYRMKVEDER